MSATDFTVDLQDIKFVLFDVLDVDSKLAPISKFEDFDRETYEATLDEAARVATEVVAPVNGPGDRQGCSLDREGNVTTPEGYLAAWEVFSEGGWAGMSAPPEAGGIGMPQAFAIAGTEMFSGAATAFAMYPGLTAGAARVIWEFGPKDWREPLASRMFGGSWGGTMCLTEADAGSSVGDNRTKAIPTGNPGEYNLVGEKIWISGGDSNLTENVIHLVLARTPDAPAGSKGLSLFIVPKFLFDDDFQITERNGAVVTGLEHKMGINGSATCMLAFGADKPALGWLVGEEGQGLPIMFHMMNEARVGCAVQGQAVGASAYNFALAYAKDRIQGTSIENFKDPNAPRVAIVEHPDVRRMLMTMKVRVEAMRSLVYRLALYEDLSAAEEIDEAERTKYHNRVELLVPIAKSTCTDQGFDVAVTGVQVMGGYGYTQEYPMEQLVRDSKIMSIYEGTNGIQAMDLLGRKLRMKGGQLFMEWLQDAQALVAECAAFAPEECGAIGKALGHVGATAMHLGALGAQGKLADAMLNATPFQSMMGDVCLALECLDQARVAQAKMEAGESSAHLRGKMLNLKFFTATYVPHVIARGKAIQANDDSCLDDVLFN